ncbi:flap endonuclease GEN isoform X5 [Leptidea sinapis]|nr:flap endonuclease GEN isoform X5 [Leptidea sinapis]
MGVRCVKGSGEAEATCARLNAKGLVDAVISQDSDCFAYGARRVYRNFSVSSSAGGGAMQGSVDLYDAEKMFQTNGFGRKKMIALALLCGCDYGVGACGTSINTVLSFLHTIPDSIIISRLLSWVTDTKEYTEQERWVSQPGRCDRCGHVGRTHLKNGCPVCASHRGCNDLGHKARVAETKRELSLRKRALSCGMPFPEPKVMKEFLDATEDDVDLDAAIPQPSLIQFVKIMSGKLDWTERYCVEKFLPVLTKWHLQDDVPRRTIRPEKIIKKRNPRGVPSYEVVWTDISCQYGALVPDEQLNDGEDMSAVWTTTERQDLIKKYFPDIVEVFEVSTRKPPKEKKARGRKKREENITADKNTEGNKPKRKYTRKPKTQIDLLVDDLNKSMKDLSITKSELNNSKGNVSVSINRLKRKIKDSKKGTIVNYLTKKRRQTISKSINRSVKKVGSDELSSNDKENNKNLLSMLDMSVPESESDLSDLVDNIVNTAPAFTTAKLNSNLIKLVFENKMQRKKKSILHERFKNCSTPKSSPRKSILNVSKQNSVNTSYFFDKLGDGCDAFEMSLDYSCKSAILDDTVNYSLPDVVL